MKNKRIIAAAMAAGMAVSLAACGSSASTTDTNGSADTATTEAADAATGEGTGFTVQLGPNPETLDPALNAMRWKLVGMWSRKVSFCAFTSHR